MATFEDLAEELSEIVNDVKTEHEEIDGLYLVAKAVLKLHTDTNLRLTALEASIRKNPDVEGNENDYPGLTNNLIRGNTSRHREHSGYPNPPNHGKDMELITATAYPAGEGSPSTTERCPSLNDEIEDPSYEPDCFNDISPCQYPTSNNHREDPRSIGICRQTYDGRSPRRCPRVRGGLMRHDNSMMRTRFLQGSTEDSYSMEQESAAQRMKDNWVENIPSTISRMNMGPGEKMLDIVIDVEGESTYLGTLPVQDGALSRNRIQRAIEGLGIDPKDIIDVSIQEADGDEDGEDLGSSQGNHEEYEGDMDTSCDQRAELCDDNTYSSELTEAQSERSHRVESYSGRGRCRRGRRGGLLGRPPTKRPFFGSRWSTEDLQNSESASASPTLSINGYCGGWSFSQTRIRGRPRGRPRGRGRGRSSGRPRGRPRGRSRGRPRGRRGYKELPSVRDDSFYEIDERSSESVGAFDNAELEETFQATDILTESMLNSGLMSPSYLQDQSISYSPQASPIQEENEEEPNVPSNESRSWLSNTHKSRKTWNINITRPCVVDIMTEMAEKLKSSSRVVSDSQGMTEPLPDIHEKEPQKTENCPDAQSPFKPDLAGTMLDHEESSASPTKHCGVFSGQNSPHDSTDTNDIDFHSISPTKIDKKTISNTKQCSPNQDNNGHNYKTPTQSTPLKKIAVNYVKERPTKYDFSTPSYKIKTPITRHHSKLKGSRPPLYSAFLSEGTVDDQEDIPIGTKDDTDDTEKTDSHHSQVSLEDLIRNERDIVQANTAEESPHESIGGGNGKLGEVKIDDKNNYVNVYDKGAENPDDKGLEESEDDHGSTSTEMHEPFSDAEETHKDDILNSEDEDSNLDSVEARSEMDMKDGTAAEKCVSSFDQEDSSVGVEECESSSLLNETQTDDDELPDLQEMSPKYDTFKTRITKKKDDRFDNSKELNSLYTVCNSNAESKCPVIESDSDSENTENPITITRDSVSQEPVSDGDSSRISGYNTHKDGLSECREGLEYSQRGTDTHMPNTPGNVWSLKRKGNSRRINNCSEMSKKSRVDARVLVPDVAPLLKLVDQVSVFIKGDLQSLQVTDLSTVSNDQIHELCRLCGLTYVSFGSIGIMKKTPLMSVRESARPQSPQSGRRVQVTSSVTPDDASTARHVQTTFLSAPPDDGAPSRSMPTSFSFPGEGSTTFGRSVPRDDSGLSIVSLGRGRPSDSGYGTDSPASLSASALRFRFGSIEGTDDIALSPSRVGVQLEPEELDFDLGLNDDDDYGDDDVFLDVVPEEEVDGDDAFAEPAFPRQPALVTRCDVVDGPGMWHGGSDGQTDTSTEEDDDSPTSSGGSGSSSNPIAIPRPLRTEALEYAVALAYTPPHSAHGGLPAGGSSAILVARGSLRQEGALWSLTQAQLSRGPNSLAVRRSALFATTSHHRNGLQRIQLEEPYRRHSDGVDPRRNSGGNVSGRPGGAASVTPRSAPPATSRRCQSESAAHLEQQFGQELRRISDEFHMSYQCGTRTRAIPGRVRNSSPGGIPHSSSLPEARGRRGSLVDRFISLFSTTPTEDAADPPSNDVTNDVFPPRRRAQSEILMATGVMPGGFGRQESLLSASSIGSSSPGSPEGSPERPLSTGGTARQEDYDELDGGSSRHGDNEDDGHHAIFHLSTEQ